MITLSRRGRQVRVAAVLVALSLLVWGTFWGGDDHFPFGPFRMYASAPDPDQDAKDTRVEGVDETGATVVLTEANSGIRRAEFEGQQGAYESDPSRLSRVADAYASHSPGAPPLREVKIVIRWHEVQDSRPTGEWHDEIVADWTRS